MHLKHSSSIKYSTYHLLQIKLVRYYNIEDLLGNDSEYKDAFANGVLTHTFLNVIQQKRSMTQSIFFGVV